MLLPLVFGMLQSPASVQAPPFRPVRVWLGAGGLLTRGAPVRVYVRAAQDGNLIVLHRRTDGRIDVLFPSTPHDDPYVRAGTYEIQATADRVAFVVAEPDGSGLVLAALAPARYRFDEFVRQAAWNLDALAPSWDGSDGEGVLSDIVQRMLGDGYFNYDIATYTVAPPAPPVYAMQQDSSPTMPEYPTCIDCTFIGFQENVFEPLALCDAFFSPCLGAHFHHFARPDTGPTPAATSTIALTMRGSSTRSLLPQNGRGSGAPAPGGFVRKGSAPVSPAIGPRGRVPVAVPLGPGRRAIEGAPVPRDVASRSRMVSGAPPQVARLTLSPTTTPDEPEHAPQTSSIVLTGLTVARAVPPASVREDAAERVVSRAPAGEALPRSRAVALAGGAGPAARVGAGTGTSAGSSVGTTQGQTIALPPAVLHGAQSRVAVGRTSVRRR
jgi:uncharacterized protein DUF4384